MFNVLPEHLFPDMVNVLKEKTFYENDVIHKQHFYSQVRGNLMKMRIMLNLNSLPFGFFIAVENVYNQIWNCRCLFRGWRGNYALTGWRNVWGRQFAIE